MQGTNKNRNVVSKISANLPFLRSFLKSVYFWSNFVIDKKKWRKLRSPIFLDLGSGPNLGNEKWTTVDWMHADITHDLRFGIPMPNASVSGAYSSHLLEHLNYESIISHLTEVKRVLEPGGVYSICVPNSELYIRAYVNGQRFNELEHIWRDGLFQTGSLMDQINYIGHMAGHHKFMFDKENIVNILMSVGFSQVNVREFGHDRDMEKRRIESIYVDAIK